MRLIDEIDVEKTTENVKDLLKDYHSYRRMALSAESIKSPAMTGMPASHGVENSIERRLIKRLEAQEKVREIDRLIKSDILKTDYQTILIGCFIQEHDDEFMWDQLHISRTTYYKVKKRAILYFAEAYRCEDLLVFKNVY